MNLELVGKIALVIGASRNMGRAVVKLLGAEGARVLAVARDHAALADLGLEEVGGSCLPIDLMLPGAVEECIDWARRIASPDIIVHVMGGSVDGIKDMMCNAQGYARVWRYNLGIAIDINNAFMQGMIERKWGRIVHFSSDAVKNSIGNVPYTSSKFAVEGYVKVASKQLSKNGVIMTAVSPGPIYTPGRFIYSQSPADTQAYFDKYLPINRFGTPEEVAGVVGFLCSERASFLAGAVIDVHGGSR